MTALIEAVTERAIAEATAAIEAALRARHHAVLATLEPRVERGQRDGTFRSDVPASWHLSMLLALVHAASAEVRSGRITQGRAEEALPATILGAMWVAAPS